MDRRRRFPTSGWWVSMQFLHVLIWLEIALIWHFLRFLSVNDPTLSAKLFKWFPWNGGRSFQYLFDFSIVMTCRFFIFVEISNWYSTNSMDCWKRIITLSSWIPHYWIFHEWFFDSIVFARLNYWFSLWTDNWFGRKNSNEFKCKLEMLCNCFREFLENELSCRNTWRRVVYHGQRCRFGPY
jgi:hypothetical protein